MLQDWWHYFLGQSQTLDYLDVFLQTFSSEGFSGLSKAPRQKQQWWGWGVDDTEWPDEAVPAVASTSGFRRQISAVRNGDGRPRV